MATCRGSDPTTLAGHGIVLAFREFEDVLVWVKFGWSATVPVSTHGTMRQWSCEASLGSLARHDNYF